VGGSRDDVATLARFQASTGVPFTLVSLPERVVEEYGAAVIYSGKTYADRVSYLIDGQGKIVWTLRDPSPLAHTNAAVAYLKKRAQRGSG